MNRLLSTLGLCMRAGMLVSGEEIVLKAVRSGEAKLVIIAADASANTIKKFTDKCSSYGVPIINCCSRQDLSRSIGRDNRVVIAVTDNGFARKIQHMLENQTEVERID